MPGHGKPTKDRRIQKTEASLRGALDALVREKPYDEIVVKEILSRANVGRSTFYTHFADKDELLLSCIHEMLRAEQPMGRERGGTQPQEQLLWFSLPIFEHIERHRQTGEASIDPRGRGTLHEHLQHAIAELIDARARVALRPGSGSARQPSSDLLVRWVAATFVLVLDWWAENHCRLSAREADGIFRALVEPSIAEALRAYG
jgi:AcrR family transcriptional regulator